MLPAYLATIGKEHPLVPRGLQRGRFWHYFMVSILFARFATAAYINVGNRQWTRHQRDAGNLYSQSPNDARCGFQNRCWYELCIHDCHGNCHERHGLCPGRQSGNDLVVSGTEFIGGFCYSVALQLLAVEKARASLSLRVVINRTLVLQSHRSPLPHDWLKICLASVQNWAKQNKYDYRFLGDELFDAVENNLLAKIIGQPIVASDLARLLAIQSTLDEGFTCVIWCDADFLIHAPEQLHINEDFYGFGREVWVQPAKREGSPPKTYTKIHNAFMFFRTGNPFLAFYIDSIQKNLEKHNGPIAPQFAGPKFLSAIHNLSQQPVVEEAGMLSPLVIKNILLGKGDALTLFKEKSTIPPSGVNLCSSLVGSELTDNEVERVIELLMSRGAI